MSDYIEVQETRCFMSKTYDGIIDFARINITEVMVNWFQWDRPAMAVGGANKGIGYDRYKVGKEGVINIKYSDGEYHGGTPFVDILFDDGRCIRATNITQINADGINVSELLEVKE